MAEHVTLEVAGREVRLSNPDKVFFPEAGHTKHDLVEYNFDTVPDRLARNGDPGAAIDQHAGSLPALPSRGKR